MILQNNVRTQLKPALCLGGCSTSFPKQPGTYRCKIQVDQGDILFGHGAYNLQTGCWDDAPDGNDASRVLIHQGETKDLEFTCGNHYGQPDDIWIFNNSYLKPATFIFSYIKNESQKASVEI